MCWCSRIFSPRTIRFSPLAELSLILADVRDLTARCHAGGVRSFYAFEELASRLLHLTVLREGSVVNAAQGPDPFRRVLGSVGRPATPLPLNDGRFLRFVVSLYVD